MSNREPDTKRPWLTYFDAVYPAKDDRDEVLDETLAFLRALLLAPDGAEDATADSIRAVQAYYRERFYPRNEVYWRQKSPDHGAHTVIGSIVSHVFNLMDYVPFNDIRHKRLADLVIGLRREAVQTFDPKNPQLGWDPMALAENAYEFWNAQHLRPNDDVERCNMSISVFAMLARLTVMLGGKSASWAVAEVVEGLEKPRSSGSTPLVLNAAGVIATQFVVFAGEVLDKQVDDTKWRTWAAKLQALVHNPLNEEQWDLRNNAQRARQRLIQLRPGLLGEDARSD